MNEGWRITPGHRSFNRANYTMRNLSENQNACISRKMCAREGVFVTRKGECDLEHQAPAQGVWAPPVCVTSKPRKAEKQSKTA